MRYCEFLALLALARLGVRLEDRTSILKLIWSFLRAGFETMLHVPHDFPSLEAAMTWTRRYCAKLQAEVERQEAQEALLGPLWAGKDSQLSSELSALTDPCFPVTVTVLLGQRKLANESIEPGELRSHERGSVQRLPGG